MHFNFIQNLHVNRRHHQNCWRMNGMENVEQLNLKWNLFSLFSHFMQIRIQNFQKYFRHFCVWFDVNCALSDAERNESRSRVKIALRDDFQLFWYRFRCFVVKLCKTFESTSPRNQQPTTTNCKLNVLEIFSVSWFSCADRSPHFSYLAIIKQQQHHID